MFYYLYADFKRKTTILLHVLIVCFFSLNNPIVPSMVFITLVVTLKTLHQMYHEWQVIQ